MTLDEKLSATVVGGGLGGRLSLDALVASPRFSLVAVADPDDGVRDGLARDYPGAQLFRNDTGMFDVIVPDVVCVSTPPASHEEVALSALELPLRGILVEKPLGHTAASGRRILEEAQARRIPMAVPHGLLAQATPLEILERIQQGDIGTIEFIEVRTSRWDIINAGIHWLQFCVTLTGDDPIDHVLALAESSTRTFRDGMQVETTAVTYVETVGGVRILMVSGDDVRLLGSGALARFRIVGSGGQIEFSGFEEGYRLQNVRHPAGIDVAPEPLGTPGHLRHLEALADAIDRDEPDYSIPESSLLALELCEAAYVSSRHRCKVSFPFRAFEAPPEPEWDPGRPYPGVGGGRDGRAL